MANHQQGADSPERAIVKHRSQRKFQNILDIAQVLYIIRNHLKGKNLFFKGYPQDYTTNIYNIIDDSVIEIEVPAIIKIEPQMTIYAILNKFVEIDLSYKERLSNDRYLFLIVGSNIAKSSRENTRIPMEPGDAFINHITASKNIIKADKYNIPTSVKVIMHQFQAVLERRADEVYISTFDEKDPKHRLIQRSNKIYYIRDAQDISSFDPLNEDFIDIRAYLQNNFEQAQRYYKNHGIVSEILSSILYVDLNQDAIPLGVIHLISKSKPLEIEHVLEAKELSFEIVDRIRTANTMVINKRQPVLDIGRGGAKILITDFELAQVLVHQSGFSFDLYFRFQAPITLYVEIRSLHWNEQKHLTLGVVFSGRSSRTEDIKRLHEFLEPLEKDAKKRLLQE